MNEEIFFKPRSGEEMTKATHGAPIYLYSSLCESVKKHGIGRVLSRMFSRSPNSLILLQDPEEMNSGHWMSLSIHPGRREIYFFSTYGGKPDAEKNRWLTEDEQRTSKQSIDILNDGLKQMAKRGWTVHYNDHKYQYEGDKTATCGIWVAGFLNSGMNPEDFWRYNTAYHLGPIDYYNAYFK